MKSIMSDRFSHVPQADISRSILPRHHGVTTTMDSGYLVPIIVDEVYPGDTFKCQLHAFLRLNTLTYPVMDNMHFDTFFFFIPFRLVWENWTKMHGERDDPADSIAFNTPVMDTSVTQFEQQSIFDYFGLPTGVDCGDDVSALYSRAYNLVWNDWFRDQNIQDQVVVDKGDGPDDPDDYVLLRRNKRHDYFTSCAPTPQKGDDVLLPLGDIAPVQGTGKTLGLSDNSDVAGTILDSVNYSLKADQSAFDINVGAAATTSSPLDANKGIGVLTNSAYSGLEADLSDATSANINLVREALQIQALLERDMRGGTRYVEMIKSHFRVICPDFRPQRPEYIGGGSSMINIHPVSQQSMTSGSNYMGDLAANGSMFTDKSGFKKSFTEHGIVLGLANIRADIRYWQGIPRIFSRQTRYDYYYPTLAHLGEQAVLNKEIYTQGTSADDDVFGYLPRYEELRTKNSMITGKMRPSASPSFDICHLAQNFGSLPSLNQAFIEDDPPLSRVLAVPTEPHFNVDIVFDYICERPIPVHSIPGKGARF